MITEGYFGNLKNYPDTDKLVCVSRKYPWFIKKERMEHIKNLAPSPSLLDDWKNEYITWEEYETRFRDAVLTHTHSIGELQYLEIISKEKTVRLMCWEKNPPCHRFILLDIFSEFTNNCEETINENLYS